MLGMEPAKDSLSSSLSDLPLLECMCTHIRTLFLKKKKRKKKEKRIKDAMSILILIFQCMNVCISVAIRLRVKLLGLEYAHGFSK